MTSKTLTWLLRHKLTEIQDDGYIYIDELIQLCKEKYNTVFTENQIIEYNKCDEKMRFQISKCELTNKYKIRATQGHTLQHVNSLKLFREIVNEDEINELKKEKVMHITYKKNINNIINNGLQPMQRKSIHFSTDINKCRNGDILLTLNVEKWLKDGHKIYKSINGYIMVLEIIHKEYLIITYL